MARFLIEIDDGLKVQIDEYATFYELSRNELIREILFYQFRSGKGVPIPHIQRDNLKVRQESKDAPKKQDRNK